jgi:hypothetical protein
MNGEAGDGGIGVLNVAGSRRTQKFIGGS